MVSSRSAAAAAIVLILGSVSALAQTQRRLVEYSAKFLCGDARVEPGSAGAAVRPGNYETSINIHNPQLPIAPLPSVTFVKKVVLALPEGEQPVPPSQFRVDRLQADFAEQVDCKIIRDMLGPPNNTRPFIEGFVVLITLDAPPAIPHELDVVGVYTVTTPPQLSISLEMVPVTPRFLTLSAGAAAKFRGKFLQEFKKPKYD
jgi:hypothetical protein